MYKKKSPASFSFWFVKKNWREIYDGMNAIQPFPLQLEALKASESSSDKGGNGGGGDGGGGDGGGDGGGEGRTVKFWDLDRFLKLVSTKHLLSPH